jgi:zinc finger MYND domain-containing protein 10
MNEVLLDQIPPLAHMLRSLEELSLMNVPTHLTVNPFVVQQVPIIASQISQNRNWQELREESLTRLSQSMDESDRQQIQRLADLYTNNTVEGLLEGFKCKKCEKQAFKRCSKCKSVWYCSRECQVADWPVHKEACNKTAKELKETEEKQKKNESV